MTARVQQALQRYLAAERELEDARWALLEAANASALEACSARASDERPGRDACVETNAEPALARSRLH
jgi:hypothetical protein